MTNNETGFFVTLRGCNETFEVCPFQAPLDEEDICVNSTTYKKMPGEYCDTKDNCYSANCTANNICGGQPVGIACKSDMECDVGLYCFNKVCTQTAGAGMFCNDTVKCAADALCVQQACVRLASIENDNATVVSATCKSFYVVNNKCSPGPILIGDSDSNVCNSGLQKPCLYNITDKNLTWNDSCVCGMHVNSTGVCKPGEGDIAVADIVSYFDSNKLNETCHILSGPFCKFKSDDNMPIEYYKALVAVMELSQGSNYKFNADCAKQTVNKDYWVTVDKASTESRFGLYLFLGIAIGAVFVIAILLLVIYFKRKGDDEDDDSGQGLTTKKEQTP
jgi:hypothetical protein